MMKSLTTVPTSVFSKQNAVHTSSIQLTHPRICAFYESNPDISPETVNLLIIYIIESASKPGQPIQLQTNPIQIAEITETLQTIKQSVLDITTRFSSEFIVAKTKYLHEFTSACAQSECSSKRAILLENNSTLIRNIEKFTQEIRSIKGVNQPIGDKIATIIRQFHKIINTNIESLLLKTDADPSRIVSEFTQNFEMNTTHMAHTINQILCDFVSAKETQTKHVVDCLRQNGDNANAAYSKLVYELHDFIHYTQNHSSAAMTSIATPQFETILSRLYSTASLSVDTPTMCVLSRETKPVIAIQHIDHTDRNITLDEIKTFLTCVQQKGTHGILVSQYTGITSKPNLYIEIQNNHVIVYVHHLEFSPEKLQTAIEIVDTISAKLAEFNVAADQKYAIPKDTLDEMNREYQSFIIQKETILTTLKDSQKKLMGQIEEIQFSTLDKYLSTRYSLTKKQGYLCNLCHAFTVSTLKGLAAHKRGCTRKLGGGGSASTATASCSPDKLNIVVKSGVDNISKPVLCPPIQGDLHLASVIGV
jgi:uncharacterized protein YfkK (UPF0435 family)